MTDTGLASVAIGPVYHRSEKIVAGVAALLKKDLYETGMLLAGKIPKLLTRPADSRSAEQMAFALEAMGLTAFIVEEQELHKPANYFRANCIAFEDHAVSFENGSGKLKRIDASGAFLIVKGRLFKQIQTNVETTRQKINISGTLMTGIPMLKKETKTVKEISTETKVFIRIYERQSMDPVVELMQHDIDYSCLGPQMTSTSQGNFNVLAKRILEAFPGAFYNDLLMEEGKTDLSPHAPVDLSVVNSRLMYLYYSKLENNKAP